MRVWLANPRGFCAGVERAVVQDIDDVPSGAIVVFSQARRHALAEAHELEREWFERVDDVGITSDAARASA